MSWFSGRRHALPRHFTSTSSDRRGDRSSFRNCFTEKTTTLSGAGYDHRGLPNRSGEANCAGNATAS
ncbi:unnamed protein product [Protopolystoma xenopodis]|uniref:Uncharacterized protein n=1 Tax=Protopolystoma xenopodis TaxID=117903 RepID=A0A3S5BBG8_9PLAT|nr:unnamed protein product [Protopolystoma xenopodis]